MASNVEKVVKVYRNLCQIPALLGARLTNNETIVQSFWSQRNLERGKTTKFLKTIVIHSNLAPQTSPLPCDISNELLSTISPSEQYRAVLRDVNEKQFLEIWQNQALTQTVDLGALELHGNIYTDGEFGSFQWSPDEKKLLYIAECKEPKSEPFYKRVGKKDKEPDSTEKTKGEEYLFRQDWGEQLVGKKRSIIAEYNLELDSVEILKGIPDDVCPAQVTYAPDGAYIVGIAYKTEPRKLGLIYCSNRPSTIFKLDFNGNYLTLALEDKSVKSPRFTPDGKYLVWLQRAAGGPHAGALTLLKTQLPLAENATPSVVVDLVRTDVEISNGRKFYGFYNGALIKRCWASDNRLVLSTNQKNSVNTYIVEIDSGKITELEYDEGSQVVLDVINDHILVNRRNYLAQDKLAICKLPQKGSEVPLNFVDLTRGSVLPGFENCIFKYMDLAQTDSSSVKTFTGIYVGPKSGVDKSVTLIVWPHGGPHSAFFNCLSLETALFLSQGYAIVFINYRGSIGQGQDNVDFLPGKIGSADVSDCILATKTVLEQNHFLNPEKLVLVGGSHGGFLVTHLSGQYPDMFKAVISRNPVIDVASMSIISDIPDWCYIESGFDYTQVGAPDADKLVKMRMASPIEHAHKVKAPTLLQIGSKDLRVPSYQGFEYYTRLKANGVTVRMNLYDDNHPLASVPNEMDNLINTVLWIQEHLK